MPFATKILVFRLSSLGDLVLASTVLESSGETRWEWVVASEFASLLEGHPRIHKLHRYDRRVEGFLGWVRLCRELRDSHFDEVWDLHGSLRSRIAQLLFWGKKPRWRRISKERFRTWGYWMFKALWPRHLRPSRWVERYSVFANGFPDLRPQFAFLAHGASGLPLPRAPFVAVMPSAAWKGKSWGVEKYADLISELKILPVVLGTKKDSSSFALVEKLKERGVFCISGAGEWNLAQTAFVLSKAEGYLGNDTGLAHLSEALGRPAWVVFGPTAPDAGFGPWRPQSRALEATLWCRPCGKDGTNCFRMGEGRFACLKHLSSKDILPLLPPHWKPQEEKNT